MSRNHLRFIARTVLVRNNDVERSYRILDKIHRTEGIFEEVRRKMFYEKPFQKRNRVSWERCKRIYNADMQKKIQFVMKKNRTDPWPR